MKKKAPENNSAQEALLVKMVSVVSHELRNPLAIMNNSLYFIKTKLSALPDADPKLNKHLGIIESEIKNANAVVGELVGYFREAKPEPRPVRLNAVVEQALAAYAPPPKVEVTHEPDESDPELTGDPAQLADAVRRVLANAGEAMPEGGAVKVRVYRDAKRPAVEISDSGPGIRPDDLHKVFEPFFTTKPRGLGLGLAVAKRTLERHGGSVDIKTQPGKGTTVRLFLPA